MNFKTRFEKGQRMDIFSGLKSAAGYHLSVKPLAFIGNASKPKSTALLKSAFSITRYEGSRWCLRRTRSGYGESTKEAFQTRLVKGVNHRVNFAVSKQRIQSRGGIVQQCIAQMEVVLVVCACPRGSVRRTSGFVHTALSDTQIF